jgi:hypothetical protein
MRPVEKKIWTDTNNIKIDKQYSPYGNAKDDLIDNLGKYCSFCEVPVPSKSSLEVEHVQPKSLLKYFHLEKSWSNFLLGCKNCNSVKGLQDVVFSELHLPHKNNSALSFQIKEGGLIEISDTIDVLEKQKAQNTLNLVGIDRRPKHSLYSKKDDRWQNRYEAWNLAQKYLKKYQSNLVDIDIIIDLAIHKGFFSVWMTVFENDLDIRQALIDNFKGTAKTCFDSKISPINRNGLTI